MNKNIRMNYLAHKIELTTAPRHNFSDIWFYTSVFALSATMFFLAFYVPDKEKISEKQQLAIEIANLQHIVNYYRYKEFQRCRYYMEIENGAQENDEKIKRDEKTSRNEKTDGGEKNGREKEKNEKEMNNWFGDSPENCDVIKKRLRGFIGALHSTRMKLYALSLE